MARRSRWRSTTASTFIGKKPAALRDNGRWECVDESAKAEKLMSVTIPPYPHYYDHHTSRGHSMRSIMPIAGDFGGADDLPALSLLRQIRRRLPAQ